MPFVWRHPAIIWANIDKSSVRSNDNDTRIISQQIPKSSITKITLKIT